MIITDLDYLNSTTQEKRIRGGNLLRNLSFNSGSPTFPGGNTSGQKFPSLVDNPDDPLRWRIPDFLSGRVNPPWLINP